MSLEKAITFVIFGIVVLALYLWSPHLHVAFYSPSMPTSEVSYEEFVRVPSPDSAIDAVVLRTNVNATTSYGYRIYIVPTGSKPNHNEENFRADHLEGWKITWKQPKLLEIQYDEARIFHFSNFWQSIDFKDASYVVEIRLASRSRVNSLSPRDRSLDS